MKKLCTSGSMGFLAKKEVKEDVVSRAGRYKEVSKNLFVKEVFLGKRDTLSALTQLSR